MPHMANPLPSAWIEKLFQKLEDFYGAKWSAQYGDFPRDRVMATWADKLGGFFDQPGSIKGALDACDSRVFPPTLPEFIGLCRDAANSSRRDAVKLLTIEAPKADPERVRALTSAAISQFRPDGSHDHKAWAKDHRRRYLAGEHLLPIQIANASAALNETWANRRCEPRKEEAA